MNSKRCLVAAVAMTVVVSCNSGSAQVAGSAVDHAPEARGGASSAVVNQLRDGALVEDSVSRISIRVAPRGADKRVHRLRSDGVEDFTFFATRPSEERVSYTVDVSHVAGLRLVSNTLELLDASGTPRLPVEPPYVVDAENAH